MGSKILGLLAATAFLAVTISAIGLAADPPAAPQVETVELRALGAMVSVGGTVVPVEEITFTAQVPGRVERVAGEEGDRFKRGEVLVAIDEEELRAQRQAALAQIANAEAAVRNAGVQYGRELKAPSSNSPMGQMMPGPMSSMFGGKPTGVERQAQVYSYGTQVEQARAALIQAQSRLQEIDARLRETKSVAPFDGVIVTKHVNQGDTVQPGQPLVNFADVRSLQVQVDVPARLALGLHEGSEVSARLDDIDKTMVAAKVTRVFPMADPTRHTVRVKFGLPETAPAAAGMYAEVLIPGQGARSERLPVIPVSAVVSRGGLPMVYVLAPDGRPELRLLRLGERLDQEHVVVLTGLGGGEQVVVNPGR